jgi:hypothetical protein
MHYKLISTVHSYIANIKILQQALEFVRTEHTWFAEHIGHRVTYQQVSMV